MAHISLFISAVTDEFSDDSHRSAADGSADYREYLRNKLAHPNVEAKIQEDFIDGGMLTLDRLAYYIERCDAVIHLVGDMTGACASEAAIESLLRSKRLDASLPPGVANVDDAKALNLSYTQWEAYLAIQFRRPLIILKRDPSAPTGGKYRSDEDQKRRQLEHVRRLEAAHRHAVKGDFRDKGDLAAEIWRNVAHLLTGEKMEVWQSAQPEQTLAAFVIRSSRPHRISLHETVVALTLEKQRQNPKISNINYTLQCRGRDPTKLTGSKSNSFMAHFEAHEGDNCELLAEIETEDRGLVTVTLPISFRESAPTQVYRITADGSLLNAK